MQITDWPAPRAHRPVDAVVPVPGSKSITNRAYLLAALSPGRTQLLGALAARDTLLMAAALRGLGVRITDDGDGRVLVDSPGAPFPAPGSGVLDVGNAGTAARFLPPLAALADGPVAFDGDPRMRERPLGPLLDALRSLGVRVDAGPAGGMPLTVHGTGSVAGGEVTLDASSSSQLVSGLLLAAPAFTAGLTVRHRGPRVPSRPHLEMTVGMLRAAGAEVDTPDEATWAVRPGGLAAGTIRVEPDLSSAAPFLAAAVVTGGRVSVPGWPAESSQPGALLPGLLARMGADCRRDGDALVVTAGDRLTGLDADLADAGELVPVLTALAALADGPSRLRGVAHLRLQETDRLAALEREFTGLGGAVAQTADGLRVDPRPLHGGRFATYHDHRLAMAAAVVGLAVDGVLVEDVATTGKTLPGFADRWAELVS